MICNRLKEIHRQHTDHKLPVATPDLVRIVCRSCEDEDTCPSQPISFEEAGTQHSPLGRLSVKSATLLIPPPTE